MRIGICHQVSLPGTWEDAIAAAATLGVDGVELFIRDGDAAGFVESPEAARALREAAKRAGVAISSLALIFLMRGEPRLADPDGAGRRRAVALAASAVRCTADAGGEVVLVGGVPPADDGAATDAYVASLRELAPAAADLGLKLGVESGLPAEAQLALLDRIGSPVVGDYFDMGNVASRGMDPVEEVRRRGSRILQVHAKGKQGAALDAGTIDAAGVARALREAGFDGWLNLETAAGDDPLGNARRNLATLRQVFV